jgi:hypothetical protein
MRIKLTWQRILLGAYLLAEACVLMFPPVVIVAQDSSWSGLQRLWLANPSDIQTSALFVRAAVVTAIYVFLWTLMRLAGPRLQYALKHERGKCTGIVYLLLVFFFLIDVPFSRTEGYGRYSLKFVEYSPIWSVSLPTIQYGRIILTQLALLAGFAIAVLLVRTLSSNR